MSNERSSIAIKVIVIAIILLICGFFFLQRYGDKIPGSNNDKNNKNTNESTKQYWED